MLSGVLKFIYLLSHPRGVHQNEISHLHSDFFFSLCAFPKFLCESDSKDARWYHLIPSFWKLCEPPKYSMPSVLGGGWRYAFKGQLHGSCAISPYTSTCSSLTHRVLDRWDQMLGMQQDRGHLGLCPTLIRAHWEQYQQSSSLVCASNERLKTLWSQCSQRPTLKEMPWGKYTVVWYKTVKRRETQYVKSDRMWPTYF